MSAGRSGGLDENIGSAPRPGEGRGPFFPRGGAIGAVEKNEPMTVDQPKDMSDDYTEINGQYATRLDGKAMASRMAEAAGKDSGKTIGAEMANPKVQVYNGNVAIPTYNYVGLTQDKDGKTEASRAKSTRVFVKKADKWVLVHANFGADPVPKQ